MRYIRNKYLIHYLLVLSLAFAGMMDTSGQDTAFTVTGTVISARTGSPLENIGVSAVSASTEAINTDHEGRFEITLKDRNDQITLSYPGYKTKTVFIHGRSSLNIPLSGEDAYSADDPVNMIFRDIPLRNIAAAVETGRLPEKGRTPAPSFGQDLQGRMSGLRVTDRSGMPGEGAYLSSRGFASLYGSSIPLVVIDGMIQKAEGFADPVIHGFHHNPLVDLDKRDISEIVLLKDAAAAGTYGIKASNGVLLITTTPPRGGKTTLDVSVAGGVSTAPPQIPVMDASHYSSYAMEQMYSRGYEQRGNFFRLPLSRVRSRLPLLFKVQ